MLFFASIEINNFNWLNSSSALFEIFMLPYQLSSAYSAGILRYTCRPTLKVIQICVFDYSRGRYHRTELSESCSWLILWMQFNAQLQTRCKEKHDVVSRFSVLFPGNLINKEENIIIQEASLLQQISTWNFTRMSNSAFILLHSNGKWN